MEGDGVGKVGWAGCVDCGREMVESGGISKWSIPERSKEGYTPLIQLSLHLEPIIFIDPIVSHRRDILPCWAFGERSNIDVFYEAS